MSKRFKQTARLCLMLWLSALAFHAGAMGDRGERLPPAQQKRAPSQNVHPEKLLVKSLLEIKHNRLDVAMNDIEDLLRVNPNFKLAHLIKGDLLLARARPLASFGSAPGASQQRVDDLREEARARLQRYLEEPPAGMVPKYLLQMQPEQRYAIVVDTGKSRLYLFQNQQGTPRYVTDYYITSGKNGAEKLREGDQKTPLGVYFVTANLPRSQLSDFYGTGAFPLSYPNEWDKRQGRNGHGIWLHGVPSDTYSRPPRASNGCVVLTNPDMTEVGGRLQPGLTPVVISDGAEWVRPEQLRAEREALERKLEAWRQDWESRDAERYLRHYSRDFAANGQNFSSWAAQKRQVNAGKTSVRVKLSDTSMFSYPGKENLVVVTFTQDYRSNNLNNQMKKRQYWIREDGKWKIIYEGSA